MKKVLKNTDATQPAVPPVRVLRPAPNTRTATSGVTGALADGDDNQRRASEVGPVLEEILHARWNHWEIHC